MKQARWILLLLLTFAPHYVVQAGRILALNGENYNGEITFSGTNRLTVAVSGSSQRHVDLQQVASAMLNAGNINFSDYARLPDGWASQNIGDVNLTGSAGISNRTFALRAAALDVGDKSDTCQFVAAPLRGDGELVARVFSIEGADRLAKVGLMLREKHDAGSRFAMLSVNANGGVSFQHRVEPRQASIDQAPLVARIPCWLKLVRRGRLVTTFYSLDGREWQQAGSAAFNLDSKASIGLALTSHSSFAMANALVDNVRLTQNGLLGEYYNDPDFRELKFTRIDPMVNFFWGTGAPVEGMNSDHFSVRWTGQLEPKINDRYVLIVDADDSADLWIDEDPVPKVPFRKESSKNPISFALVGGKRYDLKFEYREASGPASVRLGWFGAKHNRELIPGTSLFCTLDIRAGQNVTNEPNWSAAAGSGQAKGIYLRSGSFLSGIIRSVTETNVKFTYRGEKEFSVLPHKVTRIVMRVPPRGSGPDPAAGRTGLLLQNGDFFEGEITGLAGNQIRLSSVLFGFRKFNLSEVCVIHTSSAAGSPARFGVQLLDGSMFQVDTLYPEGEDLVLVEPILGPFRVPQSAVVEIRNTASRMQQ